MMGGHSHLWRPWSPYFTVVGPWYYWYGPYDPFFWSYWPYYSFYYRSYYPSYYAGGRFYRGGGYRAAPPISRVPATAVAREPAGHGGRWQQLPRLTARGHGTVVGQRVARIRPRVGCVVDGAVPFRDAEHIVRLGLPQLAVGRRIRRRLARRPAALTRSRSPQGAGGADSDGPQIRRARAREGTGRCPWPVPARSRCR